MVDIFDLNYILSSEELKQIEKIDKLKNKGIFYGLIRYFGGMVLSLVRLRLNMFYLRGVQIAYVTGTENQTCALLPISDELPGDLISLTVGYSNKKVSRNFPDLIAYLVSLFFLPCFLYRYFLCTSSYKKKAMRVCFDRFILAYGLSVTNRLCCSFFCPKLVVFSNDHCVWNRSLLNECIFRGIKTAYVQHAMVSRSFPPLKFDYSFLDGEYAFRAYGDSSIGDVFLLGAPRYQYEEVVSENRKVFLALCFNAIDSIDFIENLIGEIAELNLSGGVVVRPHPRDGRLAEIRSAAQNAGMLFSDSRMESSLALLKSSECLLAGVSGVHLDAALAGCTPFTLRGWGSDYYGFVESGLITEITRVDDIVTLKSCGQVKRVVQMYEARVGLKCLPKVSKLIASVLSDNTLHTNYIIEKNGVYSYIEKEKLDS